MKRNIIITIISCTAWMHSVLAQSAGDAMLFSRHYSGSTARSAGMGGAFGALGGDISVLSANPAGLAVYRASEFTFTPGLNFTNTRAEHDSRTFNEKKANFIVNNIGYVYTKNFYQEKGFQNISFGVAYNRLSDFYSDTYVKRPAATSSLLDEFVFYANGYDDKNIPLPENKLNAFYEGLAWNTYALDFDKNNNVYFSDYNDFGYGQPLYRSMSTRGGIGEYDFSIGANFNHTLFLGASLGIQNIYYQEYYYHEETPDFHYMNSFNFREEYSVNGWGVNFKAGVIYRPIQLFRLGVAIHTPNYFKMIPYQFTRMDTYWNNSPPDSDGEKYYQAEAENDSPDKYILRTPWQYSVSAATVIGKLGMLNVDIEVIDYSNSSISPKSTYDIENDEISAILKTSVNVKTGAEFRLGPVYLRGGVGYYGNPYNKNQFDSDIRSMLKSTLSYSGGIGYRFRDFYMDVAYSFMKHPERISNMYLSYDDTTEWYEQAKLRTNSGKFVLTFGFRF